VQNLVRFTTTFKFYPFFLIFFQSDLHRRADSRWALPQISGFIFFSAQDLRDAWVERREILHHGQH